MAKGLKTNSLRTIKSRKRTTIGRGKLKMSAMNKHKRRTYKKYVSQGR